MEPATHVMIDIETVGTAPGSAIVQIGACTVGGSGLVPGYIASNFCCGASLESCKAVGLTTSEDTLAWWAKQDNDLRAHVFGSSTDIKDALETLYLWIKGLPGTVIVWGNGASFDITLLECAYKACGIAIPWHYRNVRCYRTLTALFRLPAFAAAGISANIKQHDALADATYQADVLQAINDYVLESSNGLLRIL